jgi:hypothetical protein
MNLKAFVPAAECFEKALEVNPMLAQDEIILRSIELCRQQAAAGGRGSGSGNGSGE